jgi:hypothetical protein
MMNPHLKTLAAGTLALVAFALTSFSQIASDNGGNYGGGWSDGSNGGNGFQPWIISATPGTGFAGAFIGDPTSAGITGMSVTSFGLFANPGGSGATATVSRALSSALLVGDTFSFQWATNFDSDTGNKGFNIFSGGTGGTQILNVNQGGFPGDITFDGSNSGIAYGTGPMTWSFTLTSATNLLVTSSARDGSTDPVFTTNITVGAAPDAFSFYATEIAAGNDRQPYFNNLTVVPEPSTYALLGLGAASILWRIRRRKTS